MLTPAAIVVSQIDGIHLDCMVSYAQRSTIKSIELNQLHLQRFATCTVPRLLPHYRRARLFMQDNAGIHRSRAVAAFHQEHHITSTPWTAYSPDLKPIEHLWWVLKRRMLKPYPQCSNYSRAQDEWDSFCGALKECWYSIPGTHVNATTPRCSEKGARLAD
jgi:hypothetical protein